MKSNLQWAYFVSGVISLILFVIGPGLARFGAIKSQTGFLIFALGGLLGVIVAVIGLGILFMRGPRWLLAAGAMGFIPGATVIFLAVQGTKYPLINDVSTDLADPPTFQHAQTLPANEGREMAFPEEYKDVVETEYPGVAPITATGSLKTIYDETLALAEEQRSWTITDTRESNGTRTIEGLASTEMFRFQDDFIIRITEEAGEVTVDMRSKSRDGQGDFGANAARIKQFLSELQTRLDQSEQSD